MHHTPKKLRLDWVRVEATLNAGDLNVTIAAIPARTPHRPLPVVTEGSLVEIMVFERNSTKFTLLKLADIRTKVIEVIGTDGLGSRLQSDKMPLK